MNRRIMAALVGAMLGLSILSAPASAGKVNIPPILLTSVNTSARVVALTFDDGPSPYTPEVLAVLRRFHVHATFFLVGAHVPAFPQYVRDEVKAGDEVGDHTYSHLDLVNLSTPGVVAQLSDDQQAVHHASGATPQWFRPPYMDVDGRVIQIAASLGLRTITWSVDPSDWSLPGTSRIIHRVVSSVQPGSVVLMHDGGGDRSETVAALPHIIHRLRRKGYRFGTLDEVFGLQPMPPCIPGARKMFSLHGFRDRTHSPLYKTWADLLCRGIKLGPATSKKYALKNGSVAQDFRMTAHRLVLKGRGRHTHVRVRIEWAWAASVFSRRGLKPRFGGVITHSWFSKYLAGHNPGAAVKPEYVRHHVRVQRFVRGWAVAVPGRPVVWLHHLPHRFKRRK